MSLPCPERARRCAGVLTAALLLTACDREQRRVREIAPGATAAPFVVQNDALQAGPMLIDPAIRYDYERNAWAIAEGKTYFEAFNCVGCHAPGGGGAMGPPLIDSLWIYGSDPENIFQTIVQGRPRGMPAFGGRLPNAEVWKLVAFVRYLGGFTPQDTRPGRDDHMRGTTVDPQEGPPSARRGEIPPEQRAPGDDPPRSPPARDSTRKP